MNASTIIKKEKPNEPEYKKLDNRVKFSFMITYILLLTTATITFIEAMRTNITHVRHILNLETCISIIAGYFYSIFLTQIEGYGKEGKSVEWSDISKTRYVDWSITTPLMLLVICLVFASNTNKTVNAMTMLAIVLLNYLMLLIGYLGEVGTLSKIFAMFAGFVPFVVLFYIIYKTFIKPYNNTANNFLFGFYLFIWSLYGIVFMFDEDYKNIFMNILDCISKCFIGLGLWAYYAKILV